MAFFIFCIFFVAFYIYFSSSHTSLLEKEATDRAMIELKYHKSYQEKEEYQKKIREAKDNIEFIDTEGLDFKTLLNTISNQVREAIDEVIHNEHKEFIMEHGDLYQYLDNKIISLTTSLTTKLEITDRKSDEICLELVEYYNVSNLKKDLKDYCNFKGLNMKYESREYEYYHSDNSYSTLTISWENAKYGIQKTNFMASLNKIISENESWIKKIRLEETRETLIESKQNYEDKSSIDDYLDRELRKIAVTGGRKYVIYENSATEEILKDFYNVRYFKSQIKKYAKRKGLKCVYSERIKSHPPYFTISW